MENKVKVDFLIMSPTLDPDEISKIIQLQPTEVFRTGDKRIEGSLLTHKENGWVFSMDKGFIFDVIYIEILLRTLVNKLLPYKKAILSLGNVYKSFQIIIYSYDLMPSIYYDPKLISDLELLGVHLDHDIYCCGSSDYHEEVRDIENNMKQKIAYNLLDILDDETIAQKTELELEEIGLLRSYEKKSQN